MKNNDMVKVKKNRKTGFYFVLGGYKFKSVCTPFPPDLFYFNYLLSILYKLFTFPKDFLKGIVCLVGC